MKSQQIVEEFLEAWSSPGNWRIAFGKYFAHECVYENVGLSRTVGPAEAIAFIDAFTEKLPFVSMTVEMIGIVASEHTVMTERIDKFHDNSGKIIFEIAVMGAFEVSDGRITAWRDYFDASALKSGG